MRNFFLKHRPRAAGSMQAAVRLVHPRAAVLIALITAASAQTSLLSQDITSNDVPSAVVDGLHLTDPADPIESIASELSIDDVIVSDERPVLVQDNGIESAPEIEYEIECESCTMPEEDETVRFGDWVGYNAVQSNTTWLADSDLGMVSFESYPTLEFGDDSRLLAGTGFHLVNGPKGAADLPPRLFDLQLAYHTREAIIGNTMLDIKYGVGVFTDFEGSARKGVRFPGHIVGYNQLRPTLAAVLGLEVLDRDDISALPVGGFVWRPDEDLIFEAVFPRPRVSLYLGKQQAIYFGGELGGGTWAVERDSGDDDNVTYRDLRVVFGIEKYGDDDTYTTEIGWAFDRTLEYRSGIGDTDYQGAFVLRFHKHF